MRTGRGKGPGAWRPTTGPRGTRCLVDRALFDELALEGDEGVRALLRAERAIDVCPVRFDEPRLFEDADTPEDLPAPGGGGAHGWASPPADRGQYPILGRRIGRDGTRPPVYLTAPPRPSCPRRSSTPKSRFLRTSCANIHRGAHLLAEEATDAFESAR